MNVNSNRSVNKNALHLAATYSSNDKIVDLLIKAGANVNAANIYGTTPIFRAIVNGNLFGV